MALTLTFLGGAGYVTGSKHLLELNDVRVLLDCGMFQGQSDVRERNRSLPIPPDSIHAVILSHAHLDHCGMLPLLVKRGFTGSIYATPATRDVAEYILGDTAHIEVQDAEFRARHHLGSPDDREPLITPEDIPATMQRFVSVPYCRDKNEWHQITEFIRFKFYDAGHILGSAVTVVELKDGERTHTLAFTGDLGPNNMPLLQNPEIPTEPITTLLLESTYGSRLHHPLEESYDKLAAAINRVFERQGKMIVPAFSLGRTQLLIYILHKLTDQKKIPRFPIYVDSPLATNITDIFKKYGREFDLETEKDFPDHLPLTFQNLTYTQSVDDSKKLNTTPGPLMIISAAGMMTAGRVLHHLRNTLSNPNNAVFATGYQAEGTLGRHLVEGAKQVEIHGEQVPVRAEILTFNDFSAHADQAELIAYSEALPQLKRIFLVHGEPSQADVLKNTMQQTHPMWQVTRAEESTTVEL